MISELRNSAELSVRLRSNCLTGCFLWFFLCEAKKEQPLVVSGCSEILNQLLFNERPG
jgi:hypothetical protein